MAFSTKYTSSFDVLEGPARVLATYTIVFKKDGYSGSVIDLQTMGGRPLVAKIVNSKDSIVGIQEKKLDIEILEESDLSELQKAKPKEWRVIVTKTVGSTTITDFEGWLVPTNNATDYVDGKKYVRLEATDGINFLKNIDFVDNSGVYFEGLISVFEIFRLALQKTGLSLKINTINNTFGVNDSKNDSDEALKQRFLDMDLFRGDNEPQDTYKVLGKVVESEKCRVFQRRGEWWIVNVAEQETGYVKSRKHDTDGSFISGGTLNLRIDAVNGSDFQPMAGGTVSNVMPIKWAKVEHKLGKFKNRLLNKDFVNYSSGSFTNWFKSESGISVSRDGDGTSANLYGVKISGYANKTSVARSLYQSIDLGVGHSAAIQAIKRNITFSGKAYTHDVKSALVKLILIIETGNSGIGYFGLSDSGEWIRKTTDIGLDNIDINGHSKKAPVNWNIVSKKIEDITFYSSVTGKMVDWIPQVTKVSIVVHLCEGIVQVEPYPGETQSSYVVYKDINVGWIDADTNLNLLEIHYKATQSDYAPNDETLEAIYGDYVDGSNLSALKDINGNITTNWISANSSTPKNFHAHGVSDILDELGGPVKVYDGTIWGLLEYHHSVGMAGFDNRGYIVGYTFNYATTKCDVRIIEHSDVLSMTVKKTGVLSDGTEIEMVSDSTPATYSGNSTATTPSFFNIQTWLQQLLSGIQGITPDDQAINVVWDNIATDDTFDFGSIVKRNEPLENGDDNFKLVIGDAYDTLTLGNKDNQTLVEVLGGKLNIGDSKLYSYNITTGDDEVFVGLGIDSHEFQVDGRIMAVGGVEVGQGGVWITKQITPEGLIYGQITAETAITVNSPIVNFPTQIYIKEVGGIGENPVQFNTQVEFNQPIFITESSDPRSAVTKQQLETAVADLNLGEFGQYINSNESHNIFDAPYGASYVAGLLTNLPNGMYKGHSIKMAIGQDKPNEATYMAFGLPRDDFNGKIYLRGIYENGEVDTGWKAVGGDIQNFTIYRNEAEIQRLGYYYEIDKGDQNVFVGFDKTNGDFEIAMMIADSESVIVTEARTVMRADDGRLCYQFGNNEPVKYALTSEVGTGAAIAYSGQSPISVDGTLIKIQVANGSQNGYLSSADWTRFDNAASGDLNFILNRAIYWRNAGITDPNNYAAKLFWAGTGTPVTTNVFTSVQGLIFEADTTMNLGASGNMNIKGNKIFLNSIEIDMSAFATGKVLKATSSSKAEWVTL